ncbi:hypothetical protein ACWOCB_06590 [Gemella haemolysans]|uniref:HNH domain-containing protein n=1 Tax=Gemella haemolysans ATCC 10379 TaxID=546270 RepID=C5NWH8_9BACL|nr:hypothetical protein [Gemella haemolysans]EER68456.1 hypothetical protein GEMHA0001_1118 [Gemella haemolysans ATCC 10379]KAA8707204.1 hypothetical protein F4V11_06510 [Gemella haemolysans]UBH82212.1 hypothetical protein LA340_07805 [Gemella haemolysans]VEI37871.1 Uncharacterised protein [Gemella haemolysans]
MMYLKIPNYPQEFIDAYVKFMFSKYINEIDRIDVKSKKSKKSNKANENVIKHKIKGSYLLTKLSKKDKVYKNSILNNKMTQDNIIKEYLRVMSNDKMENCDNNFIADVDSIIKERSSQIIELFRKDYSKEFNTFFEYFKELLLMKPEDMEKYVYQNRDNNTGNWECIKSLYNLSKVIDVAGKPEKINTLMVRNFIDFGGKGLLVCPYCNRNYVNNRGKALGSEIDHIYNKNKYPMFAISLYNFIPSCSSCNRIKWTKELKINPFLRDNTNKIKFDITKDVDGYKIDFIHDLNGNVTDKNNIEELKKDVITLRLDEAYEIHDIEIKEMVERERKFGSEYREFLKKIFPEEGFELEKKIDELIYGDVVFTPDEELINKSLGKFKKDVYEKIKEWKE